LIAAHVLLLKIVFSCFHFCFVDVQQLSPVFFQAVFGCQNVTLKFFSDTLNSESQDMVLPCIEVKRFEESMFSCKRLLQLTAAML